MLWVYNLYFGTEIKVAVISESLIVFRMGTTKVFLVNLKMQNEVLNFVFMLRIIVYFWFVFILAIKWSILWR